MKLYNIGISCIGSGIGQSIINSCRLSDLPLRTIGLGTNPFAFGSYDCDLYDYTPSIYDSTYVDILVEKCKKFEIDLLIPGLDDEALLLSRSIRRFEKEKIKVIVSGEKLLALCNDKERTTNELNTITNVFVKSYSKEKFLIALSNKEIGFPVIAKPRSGFASRGIRIISGREEIDSLNEEYVLQEIAIPHSNDPSRCFYLKQIQEGVNSQVSELSVQIVADSDGNIRGKMALHHNLKNGIPIETMPFESDELWHTIDLLFPTFKNLGLRGPLNIQGRITDDGIKFFEMNARFTGLSALRALMGFNEVVYCIRHWLGINTETNYLTLNANRFGIRQTADRVVPIERNERTKSVFLPSHLTAIPRKNVILLTGATGYLGRNLVARIIADDLFELYIYSRDKSRAREIISDTNIRYFDYQDFQNNSLSLGKVDIIIHAGFARPHCTNAEIAEALLFTGELFTRATMNNVPAIVNISSQSVYGLDHPPLWKEYQLPAPASAYGQAKYASEVMLNNLHKMYNQCMVTSLRLSSLTGGQDGLLMNEVVSKFTYQALKGLPIHIMYGKQQVERLDVRDAVSAILRVLKISPTEWQPVYNIGSGKIYTITEIAQIAVEKAKFFDGRRISDITIEKSDLQLKQGMDSSLFRNEYQWEPQFGIEDIIDSLCKYYIKHSLCL